jgi:hypothetical protein
MRPLKLSVLATPASVAALVAAFGAAGCGGGHAGPDANEALACETSKRGDTFAVGLEHMGMNAAYKFTLMSADPATPSRQQRGTWVIQINWEATGAPVTGASLTVSPFMPDHQHGPGAYTPQIQALPTPGQYQISDINTWMPGYWEITIDAMTPDKVEDSAVFKVCVDA